MRILFYLETGYPPEATGGLQINTHELALALLAHAHEPIVLASRPIGRRDEPDVDEIYHGYRLIRAGQPVGLIKELVAAFAVDAVVVQTATRIVGAMLECYDLGVPCLVYMVNVETQYWGGQPVNDPAFLFLSTSEFVAARVRAVFGIDSEVLLPFIDPSRHIADQTGTKVLFINPHPLKGSEIFFGVAERLRKVPFLVAESWEIGDEWRNYCFRRAAPLGNMDWRRRVDDMRTIWRETKLLFVPSVWEEAWARVVSEAQLNGIPVIASTRGGLPESVGPGGILLDAHAPIRDWAAAVERAWGDEDTYRGLSGAARRHAARDALQPATVYERFMGFVAAHIAAVRARQA
ncbi:MAG: glycosyltransferase [Alphaproteobacteria bacterium]